MEAGGGGAASSTRLTLEQRGAHHVALIQPPLQSNASPHSHTTCAFPPETAGCCFFFNHFAERAKLKTRKATGELFSFEISSAVWV